MHGTNCHYSVEQSPQEFPEKKRRPITVRRHIKPGWGCRTVEPQALIKETAIYVGHVQPSRNCAEVRTSGNEKITEIFISLAAICHVVLRDPSDYNLSYTERYVPPFFSSRPCSAVSAEKITAGNNAYCARWSPGFPAQFVARTHARRVFSRVCTYVFSAGIETRN